MIKDKGIKKWGFLVSLFVLFLISPFKVRALQSLTITGDDSISPGATIKYDVVLNSDDMTLITGFSTDVYYESSVFTLSSVEVGTGWTGDTKGIESGNSISFTSETGITGNSIVATLVFKVNASATSNISYITLRNASYTFKDETGAEERPQLEEVTKNLTVKSSDNSLTNITINGVSVDGFVSDIYEYDINIGSAVEVANIVATPKSSKATFKVGSGNREVPLNYGSNVIDIVVISESGLEKTYKLNITREDTRSTDTTLSNLTVDGVKVTNFKKNVYKYNVIRYKLSKIDIVGTPNDAKATVKVTPPTTIVEGNNNYIVTVTSENGNTAIYTVVVNNIVEPINKKLKTLSIKGYNIDFDKNNNRYEISYNKDKFKNLHVYFSTVSNSDLVTAVLTPDINNNSEALSKLKAGDEITIAVTGIDNETVEYTIVITKDNRVSFFLVLELFVLLIIVIVVIVYTYKRKERKSKSKSTTKVVKKENTVKNDDKKDSSKDIEKPKKKKFSIFEDVEDEEEKDEDKDQDDDLSSTKEFTNDELKLK